MKRLPFIILGVLSGSAIASALAPRVEALEKWGNDQPITYQQMVSAQHLAFPQSYGAMVGLLGYPEYRSSRSDWFLLPRRSGYLRVDYGRNGKAVAIAWES